MSTLWHIVRRSRRRMVFFYDIFVMVFLLVVGFVYLQSDYFGNLPVLGSYLEIPD